MRRLATICALLTATGASADPLSGDRIVYLAEADGTRHEVGKIAFGADGSYDLQWQDTPFANHFLSMRPFKCMEGPAKHWCRVPYPYENRRTVGAKDLTDLEYDLLFVWKGSGEYGINMWNGVYYRLEPDGDRLIGALHEMDMDILSAPPDDGNLRPIRGGDLTASDPESHWLPYVIIE